MKIRAILTAACTALSLVVTGAVLAPDGQAETLTPQSDHAIPNAGNAVSGISIPDSKLARDAAQRIRDTICCFSTLRASIIGLPWQESARA
jgi:hypothetical protein